MFHAPYSGSGVFVTYYDTMHFVRHILQDRTGALKRLVARKCIPDKVDATIAENLGSAITDVPCAKLKELPSDAKMIIRKSLSENSKPLKAGKLSRCFGDVVSSI